MTIQDIETRLRAMIVDRLFLSVAPEDIRRARPLMTIVAGEIRHRKGA